MRILIFHGYLLRGTGSNVYNASLASALLRLGHEVHLLCQDRHAAELEFVGAVGSWDSGELVVERVGDARCTVYRPDIGGLLPVYVADRYEAIDARPFPELSDTELQAYIEANVAAVSEVVALCKPDVALANHLVMGPAILARALSGSGVRYAVKIHGSALEYTVKPHPRFLRYALEGIGGASGVLVGSRHTAQSLWEALDDPSVPGRTRLGPPGVEVSSFRPLERGAALERLRTLAEGIGGPQTTEDSAFARDAEATTRALAELASGGPEDRLVAFVGKLIVAKGIDLLLLAWPLVLAEVPAARLAVVGFGAYRSGVERLIEALASGQLPEVRSLAESGRAVEGGPRSRLEYVLSFLDWLEAREERSERYLGAAARMRDKVVLTGRLEHDELADLLPLCEALVVPSTFAESFGMVSVEAAACGALPIAAGHSGLAEVSETLTGGLPESVRELATFALGPEVVQSIAACLVGWLGAPASVRDAAREVLVEVTRERYSWESVAQGVIAAASGQLEQLDPAV